MNFRPITEQQARQVLKIIVEECDHKVVDQRDGDIFVRAIETVGKQWRCAEYRLNSALGFGGKFLNNGNCNNIPHVDCYPEDETPTRLAMIAAANKRLAELFGPAS